METAWFRSAACRLLAFLLLYGFAPRFLVADADNGFDLSDSLVPVEEIHHGGPARDGIPAIDRPRFVNASVVDYLLGDDRVLGINRNGISKAYPINILNHHEIVNDDLGREAIVISYCPLCGTGMAFLASVEGSTLEFGVSGLLYNSDVLLYDRQTESLWSQLMRQAITGPMRGQRLEQIVMSHTTWRAWKQQHPDTLVMSRHTGFRRDYSRTPYAGYARSEAIYFPVANRDHRYHPKELVIGVSLNGYHKAYPFAELSRTSGVLRDRFAGQQLRIQFDAANRTGRVLDRNGREIPSTISFWFAWYAFHPEGEVYKAL
jgi:hypothetical protein